MSLASSGALSLPLVIVCATLGAMAGDNISYGLGGWLGERRVKRLFGGDKSRRAFDWAERQLEARGFYLIIIARFIPGGRTAVTFSCGYTDAMPWRRFIVADVIAATLWGTIRRAARIHRRQAVRGRAVERTAARVLRRPRR